ncbi:MAG: 50S ribosomal protein L34 [Planctomycetota bacterium]
MKIKRRNSNKKYRKMTGFRRRMRTRNGRKILANQRRKKKNLAR